MEKRKSATKKPTPRRKPSHKRASFSFMAPDARSVHLAGDFNSWDPDAHPLKKSSAGLWKINLNLSPGRYEYRFVVDGQWQNDPHCQFSSPNPFGEENSVIVLG